MGTASWNRGDVRASDAEREDALTLLRSHHLDGRLSDTELEERTEEVCRARFRSELWGAMRELPLPVRAATPPRFVRPPAGEGTATTALVLGAVACLLVVLSFGVLFPVILPLGAAAVVLGGRARRSGATRQAVTAQLLGMVAVFGGFTGLAGCAALLSAF